MSWPIGPSSREIDAYRGLLDRGPMVPRDLAHYLDCAPGEAEVLLQALVRHRLANLASSGLYLPAPPTDAVAPILRRSLEYLAVMENEARELDTRYRALRHGSPGPRTYEIHSGVRAVDRRARELLLEAKTSIRSMAHAADVRELPDDLYPEFRAPRENPIEHRVLVEHQAVLEPKFPQFMDLVLPDGAVFRAVPAVPSRMLIVDAAIVAVPLRSVEESSDRLLVLRTAAIADVMVALFECAWQSSSPIVSSSDTRSEVADVDAMDRRIVSLLLMGLSDEQIAAHVGSSLRTLQRRVRGLMDRTGAGSRVQLGFEAGRRDWLEGRGESGSDFS